MRYRYPVRWSPLGERGKEILFCQIVQEYNNEGD